MFKLFTHQHPTKEEVQAAIIPSKGGNYPAIVQEIHNEFDTAATKLLKEAQSAIDATPKVNTSKVNKLKALGFNQVQEVETIGAVLETISTSKEQIALVEYYQQHYPFNKYISEEQVEIICKKYNLVCGEVSRFRGFVPEKNVNDITNFKLKVKDTVVEGVLWGGDDDLPKTVISILESNYLKAKGDKIAEDKNWCFAVNIGHPEYTYFDDVSRPSLQICAPVKDMDISGLELENGYKLIKKHIPDPVVLQPVKNGYLILTAWGDEASDPLVVNQNFN